MPEKVCRKCGEAKDCDFFGNLKSSSDGLQAICKKCLNARNLRRLLDPAKREKERERLRRRYHEHPEGNAAHLKMKYGISVAEYNRMVEAQHGLCAICQKPQGGKKKRLAVDHDHRTGRIRGLLCCTCNTAIGHLMESTNSLERAVRYLSAGQESFEPYPFVA